TALVKDINATTLASSPRQFLTVGNVTYFVADDGTNGQGIWKSDGTEQGTALVKGFPMPQQPWPMANSLVPWPVGPMVGNLTEFQVEQYFTDNDGKWGPQL